MGVAAERSIRQQHLIATKRQGHVQPRRHLLQQPTKRRKLTRRVTLNESGAVKTCIAGLSDRWKWLQRTAPLQRSARLIYLHTLHVRRAYSFLDSEMQPIWRLAQVTTSWEQDSAEQARHEHSREPQDGRPNPGKQCVTFSIGTTKIQSRHAQAPRHSPRQLFLRRAL